MKFHPQNISELNHDHQAAGERIIGIWLFGSLGPKHLAPFAVALVLKISSNVSVSEALLRLRHHLESEIVDAALARHGCCRVSIMVASSKTSTAHDTNT